MQGMPSKQTAVHACACQAHGALLLLLLLLLLLWLCSQTLLAGYC
jgi:hypothetical protein